MAVVVKRKKSDVILPYIPVEGHLKDGRKVILDWYKDEDEEQVHSIVKYIVNEEGDSYPQENLSDVEDFRGFFASHDVFVCRDVNSSEVLASFYVKPNFPDRCSHICNGGFAVKKSARRLGIGKFIARHYLQVARDLGYQASLFNLVFVTNEAAVGLWRSMGFTEIGRIPNAGNLKGHGNTDAIQFYYDLSKIEKKA
ncbi:uncharacterized protein LOC132562325 [Ylistrum balloti]|uniref:uncharacterized protein LOC132562325 n=1 Tax=Ylistrum balloti TaxID=509963 RepID=UPI002905E7F5|nr:uncharacterized protein LOC132562325 [Ylistrum balloti]